MCTPPDCYNHDGDSDGDDDDDDNDDEDDDEGDDEGDDDDDDNGEIASKFTSITCGSIGRPTTQLATSRNSSLQLDHDHGDD